MKLYWMIAACIALVCAPGSALFADGKPAPVITEISLERTECFGTCPAYKVTLRPDGTVTYVGKAHVERKGTFTGHFDPKDFRRLAEVVNTSHFDKLNDHYGDAVDKSIGVTTVVWGSKRKTVVEMVNEQPTSLWTIEMVIDAIACGVDDWKQKSISVK